MPSTIIVVDQDTDIEGQACTYTLRTNSYGETRYWDVESDEEEEQGLTYREMVKCHEILVVA